MAPVTDRGQRRPLSYLHQMSPASKALVQHRRLALAEVLLAKTCDQLLVLDRREGDLETRYRRARSSGRLAARHSLHIQLRVLTNFKKLYYEFARRLADYIELQQTGLRPVDVQDQDAGVYLCWTKQ